MDRKMSQEIDTARAFNGLEVEVRSLTAELRAGREMAQETIKRQREESRALAPAVDAIERTSRVHAEEIAKLKAEHEKTVSRLRQEIAAISAKSDAEALFRRAINLGKMEGFMPHWLTIDESHVNFNRSGAFKASQQGAFGQADGFGETVLGAVADLLVQAEAAGKKRREAIEAQFPVKK